MQSILPLSCLLLGFKLKNKQAFAIYWFKDQINDFKNINTKAAWEKRKISRIVMLQHYKHPINEKDTAACSASTNFHFPNWGWLEQRSSAGWAVKV